MARAGSILALVGAALVAACSGSRPPSELSGLWSAGAAACDAGVGVRFTADAILAVYRDQSQTLFERPSYQVEQRGQTFRVRISYRLPRAAGGARSAGAHGVLVLARQPGGGVAPESHTLIDPRTGAARQRILNDPAVTALTLQPCGDGPWRDDELRGRAEL